MKQDGWQNMNSLFFIMLSVNVFDSNIKMLLVAKVLAYVFGCELAID